LQFDWGVNMHRVRGVAVLVGIVLLVTSGLTAEADPSQYAGRADVDTMRYDSLPTSAGRPVSWTIGTIWLREAGNTLQGMPSPIGGTLIERGGTYGFAAPNLHGTGVTGVLGQSDHGRLDPFSLTYVADCNAGTLSECALSIAAYACSGFYWRQEVRLTMALTCQFSVLFDGQAPPFDAMYLDVDLLLRPASKLLPPPANVSRFADGTGAFSISR
jgi:hypothetical protein